MPGKSKHGGCVNGIDTPEYRAWKDMKRRCMNKNFKSYPRYGGRGIAIDPNWLGTDGFANFLRDVGNRPTPKHTLDRKDNDKVYNKENCYWSTMKDQSRNKSNNCVIEFRGESLCLCDWAKRLGITVTGLRHRLKKTSVESALTTPVRV